MLPEASEIKVIAIQEGAEFEARFQTFQADIRFDRDHLNEAHVRVEISTSSFNSRFQDRDETARGPAFFASQLFPLAIFETLKIDHKKGPRYEAKAHLTLRDITRKVTLPFTLDIETKDGIKTARMRGELTLKRLEFGIGQGEWKSTRWVGDKVIVRVNLVATALD